MSLQEELLANVDQLKAADAADLLLSPHIDRKVLHHLTRNEGPAMWIVNRSDVFSETLDLLKDHPDLRMSVRAKDKIKARTQPPQGLPEPQDLEADEDISKMPTPDVEEILGHPQVPLNAIWQLSFSEKEEHRASAVLSFTRRLLEYPPIWNQEKVSQEKIENRFEELLLADKSAFVRSYCTRLPFLNSALIEKALHSESHGLVRARLLQHPHLSEKTLQEFANETLSEEEDPRVECVLALDKRLKNKFRADLLSKRSDDLPILAELTHRFYMELDHDLATI